MARPLRLEFAGALFHITSRGNEQRDMFRDDVDRVRFLEFLGETVDRFRWIVYAYVLMSNHFHLLIELVQEATLSRGMKWLNEKHAQTFNRRHQRVGHLIQGRFHAPLIEKETYFLEVARYVVLNPVRASMVDHPEAYKWSSYRATVGEAAAPEWLASDDLLAHFAKDRSLARARYAQFVNDRIALMKNPWTDLVGDLYLGSDTWIERMREKVELKPRSDEHPRAQRLLSRSSMSEIVTAVADVLRVDENVIRGGHGGIPRMLAAWLGSHEGLLTNREVAAGLGLGSGGRVTALVRECDRELGGSDMLQGAVDRCLATLRRKNSQLKV
jgi:putative transposase